MLCVMLSHCMLVVFSFLIYLYECILLCGIRIYHEQLPDRWFLVELKVARLTEEHWQMSRCYRTMEWAKENMQHFSRKSHTFIQYAQYMHIAHAHIDEYKVKEYIYMYIWWMQLNTNRTTVNGRCYKQPAKWITPQFIHTHSHGVTHLHIHRNWSAYLRATFV